MSTSACAAYGGTFCYRVDCSELSSCIARYIEEESDNKAYVTYLKTAPTITDATSEQECAKARDYFGYDPDFVNDRQICEDIQAA